MNGGGLVLFVVLFYAGAIRELSQFAAVDVDGDLAAKWLQKKSEDRRGICRTACATSIPPRRSRPYNALIIRYLHNSELCSYGLCMAKRVLKMAIRCLLFDRSMSTMQLLSSVCQRIGNTVSFFCQHSMHIFIKRGRSGPYVSKMTTFCLYMAAGSVVYF